MITLLSIELYKIIHKWRTFIGIAALSGLIILFHIALYIDGAHYLEFLTKKLSQIFLIEGNFLNGYLIALQVLGILYVHLPFFISLVTADLFAGEATAGTYRMLLTRPYSRAQIATAKFLAGQIYAVFLVIVVAVISLGLGVVIFGTGELIVARDGIVILAKNDILWRFAFAYGFACISMGTVASLSCFFSSLVENAIGPIVSTMAVIIVFLVISSFDASIFKAVKPYLFTTYMSDWRLCFDEVVDFGALLRSALILIGHSVLFSGITLVIFRRKDILS
jgi:ABC-2 type transport system permease protein